jgi:hypothetical protein
MEMDVSLLAIKSELSDRPKQAVDANQVAHKQTEPDLT